mmetsp:Transcript_661/g.2028  ORF Transcript_661/g.2028 Transcript_661/m.2028 type:complete len:267 (+) Transcript_661:254-1054(+)
MLRAATAVDGGLLVMAQIRLQALQMSDGHGSYLGPGLLLVLLEGVAGQHFKATLRKGAVDEVHEGVADVAHAAGVDRRVDEVEGPCEAHRLQLMDQLLLRVAVRDVPDHHGGRRCFRASLGELLCEVLAPRYQCMSENQWSGGSLLLRQLSQRLPSTLGARGRCLQLLFMLNGVPILGRHRAQRTVRPHGLQARGRNASTPHRRRSFLCGILGNSCCRRFWSFGDPSWFARSQRRAQACHLGGQIPTLDRSAGRAQGVNRLGARLC